MLDNTNRWQIWVDITCLSWLRIWSLVKSWNNNKPEQSAVTEPLTKRNSWINIKGCYKAAVEENLNFFGKSRNQSIHGFDRRFSWLPVNCFKVLSSCYQPITVLHLPEPASKKGFIGSTKERENKHLANRHLSCLKSMQISLEDNLHSKQQVQCSQSKNWSPALLLPLWVKLELSKF